MLKVEKSQYLHSIFQLNYTKYEKMLWYKIVHYIKIYKFEPQHFSIRCIFFFLIKKNITKNPKFNFLTIIYEIHVETFYINFYYSIFQFREKRITLRIFVSKNTKLYNNDMKL